MEANTEAEMLEDMAKRFCPTAVRRSRQTAEAVRGYSVRNPAGMRGRTETRTRKTGKSTRTAVSPGVPENHSSAKPGSMESEEILQPCLRQQRTAKRKEREGNEG